MFTRFEIDVVVPLENATKIFKISCAGWILPSATQAWLFVWNVADSASAGIHGRPPVWLVGQVVLVKDCTATCWRRLRSVKS